jgi:hypothetical protein
MVDPDGRDYIVHPPNVTGAAYQAWWNWAAAQRGGILWAFWNNKTKQYDVQLPGDAPVAINSGGSANDGIDGNVGTATPTPNATDVSGGDAVPAVTSAGDLLGEAFKSARNLAKDALDSVRQQINPGSGVYERFRLWFGDPSDYIRKSKVEYVYSYIYSLLASPENTRKHTEVVFGPWADSPWGWHKPLPDWKIFITDKGFGRGLTPPSSIEGIMIHEAAHIVDDAINDQGPIKIYSEPENLNQYIAWARSPESSPTIGNVDSFGLFKNDKINEADSYKYFAERQP